MFKPQHKYVSPFRSQCVTQATDIVEQMDDDGYMEEVAVPKPQRKKKYLPGEKLLVKIRKQKEKEREKNRNSPVPLDMGKIQEALSNIIEGF